MKATKKGQPAAQRELSIQAQLEANDVPEYANEPGPGHYFGPENNGFSSLGPQKFAKCPSAPEIEFARTGWQEWKKVIISKGHEGAYKLRDSPGAVYDIGEGSLDKKTCVMGTSQRPDLCLSLGMNPEGSPGPKYNVRDSKPHIGDVSGAPKMNSKADRFDTGYKLFQGPGPYDRKDSCLKLGTGRSFGIGRAAYEKVIRPGWEKDGQCRVSSKIGDLSIWRDLTKEPCSPAQSIGNARRFAEDLDNMTVERLREKCRTAGLSDSGSRPRLVDRLKDRLGPGPGQYRRDERDMSRCSSVCSDTRNASGAPFGRRMPRKPRFRQMLAMTTAKHGGWGYF